MKCCFILTILLFSFHVIGGGKFKGHLIEKNVSICLHCPQVDSQGFCSFRLVDLTEASPTIVENCIQGRNLNNIKWLCLKKCTIWKLPSNLFYCLQLQILDLAPKFRKHTFIYWLIECTPRIRFIKVFPLEITTFIYWPIECTLMVSFVKVC